LVLLGIGWRKEKRNRAFYTNFLNIINVVKEGLLILGIESIEQM